MIQHADLPLFRQLLTYLNLMVSDQFRGVSIEYLKKDITRPKYITKIVDPTDQIKKNEKSLQIVATGTHKQIFPNSKWPNLEGYDRIIGPNVVPNACDILPPLQCSICHHECSAWCTTGIIGASPTIVNINEPLHILINYWQCYSIVCNVEIFQKSTCW